MRLVAAAAVVLALGIPSAGASPGGNGAILYVSGQVPGGAEVRLSVVGAGGGDVRALTPAVSAFEPAVSPDGLRVAFTAVRGGNPDVYVRDADGRETRLTTDPAADAQAAWSPDGRRLAFVSERRGRADVYVMAVDGSDVRRVTTNPGAAYLGGGSAGDTGPVWSPDGVTIAYARYADTGAGLHVVGADGTGDRRVTVTPAVTRDSSPTWSHDGRTLAFARVDLGGRVAVSELRAVTVDTSAERALPGTAGALFPAWSPDGASIAFLRGHELSVAPATGGAARVVSRAAIDWSRAAWRPGSRELVFPAIVQVPPYRLRMVDPRGSSPATLLSYGVGQLAEPDWSPEGARVAYVAGGRLVAALSNGRARKLLTRAGAIASEPAWSPDGSWIAFATGGDLYAVAADGSRLRRVMRTVVRESEPAWSPDGRWIAYAAPAERGGDLELWRVRPDGSGRRRLTANTVVDQSPAWSPDGRRLAFVSGRTELRFNPELWVMDADGGAQRRVQAAASPDSREVWSDERPAWSPDGNWLAYTSRGDLWIVHPDGTGAIDLTPDAASLDFSPSWQPVCTRSGTASPNRLAGTSGAEILCGRMGPDRIVGGRGRDRLFGEYGDDTIDARDGAFDVVGCGAGRDIVRADRIDLVGVDCEVVTRR